MAYVGKYIDRNPCIKTAGVSFVPTENVGDSLKVYPNEEAAEGIIKAKCLKHESSTPKHIVPRTPSIPKESMKDIFSTELKKSRFVAFREKFSEDMFFKKPELGKVFQLQVKPDHITNDNTTFGDTSNTSEPIYELILPKKSPNEVNRESAKFHDKYVLSHNHYFPSERINRHYDKNFNPAQAFGLCRNMDVTGGNVKRCLTQCERLIIINKAQKVFLEMSMGKLGKRSKRREGNIPPDAILGHKIRRDACDAKALIENIDPCVNKIKLIESVAHINQLRRKLFSRVNFHIHDLKSALEYLDDGYTGFLPLSKIFDAAHSLRIHMDPEKIRTAANLFELFVDEGLKTERVNYKNFLQILQIQYPLPKTGNISTMPDNVYNKETTYRELCKDLNKKPIGAVAPIHAKVSKEDKTTAKDLISPDIPLQYGLDQSDFEEHHTKNELQRIFKRTITDPNGFEEIWQKAVEKLKPIDNLISVDEFRLVMNNPD